MNGWMDGWVDRMQCDGYRRTREILRIEARIDTRYSSRINEKHPLTKHYSTTLKFVAFQTNPP